METKNYFNMEALNLPSGWMSKFSSLKRTLPSNFKKLFTFMAVIAITSFFSAKADWVKNVTLANHDFLTGTSTFTTANSNLSGNNVGAPTITNGYMFAAASGSGGRGTKITNMTSTEARQDTVYYEFDWNPFKLIGQANSEGNTGTEPAAYGVTIIRGSNDSIVFGLWFERWSLKAGSKYHTDSINAEPLGDIHLMNISTDAFNPMPARIVEQTLNGITGSYYTNTLVPFAMIEPGTTNFYAVKCDSINKSTNLGRTFKMNRWYHIKAAIDFKTKRIISFEIFERDAATENKKTFTDLPFVNTGANDVSRFEIASTRGKTEGATGNGVNCNYEQRFDNIDIYTMRQVAASATVTIKYVDDNGIELKSSKTIPSLEVNTVYTATASDKVTIVIGNDYYIYDESSVDNVVVALGGSEIVLRFKKAIPKNTVVQLVAPATSELYKDATIDISVKTPENDIVPMGDVLLFVNNLVKNRVKLDVMGSGTIVMPNLLVGDVQISAVYIGDYINYSHSDTVKTMVTITPSTSSVKPYPVYFDLCDQPEIAAYDRERGMTTATPRPYTHYFRTDSLPGITVSDTINNNWKVGYYYAGSTYGKIDDSYNRADFVMVPLGSGRPTWVKFKTPWLNAGSYNVYISHRVSGDPKTNMTSITMNDKEVYFPNEEMYGRWFKSWAGTNNRRRWNATGHSGNMGMNYIGTASIDNSGTQSLKINVVPENGATYNLDMLQFIPVDQDSLNVNLAASVSMAKLYFPMFDWLGFAQFQTGIGAATYADYTEFAVPYQVSDLTEYTKYPFTINNLGIISVQELLGNYVIVYRAEDKWTRVAEGSIEGASFTGELPVGDYYYEEINYIDMGVPGGAGYRTYISSGLFSVGESSVNPVNQRSEIFAYSTKGTLNVKGLNAGDKVFVTDITGKVLINTKASTDNFTTSMNPSVYIVKVISAKKGTHVMKVVIK